MSPVPPGAAKPSAARYSPLVAARFADPAYAGTVSAAHEVVVSGAAGQRAHGTEIVFHLGIDAGRISAIRFEAFGCPHTIAACSLTAEALTDAPVADLAGFAAADLARQIDLPVEKTGRLLIIEDALRNCLNTWENKRFTRNSSD